MSKKIWIAGIVVCLAVVMLTYYFEVKQEKNLVENENPATNATENSLINVTLYINFNSTTIWNYNLSLEQKNATVFNALLIAAHDGGWNVDYTYYEQYDSYFINSIDGKGGNGKYWIYYVNGEMGEVGADKKILHEGDEVEWRLE